jgi:hypothetical protein
MALVVALAAACGDPEDGEGPGYSQTGNPVQNGDAALPDTGVVVNPVVPDAGTVIAFDAGLPHQDAGSNTVGFDAGVVTPPLPEASVTGDAGNPASDAGPKSDASAGDGGACALTYENFGKQFMTSYCVSCHSGIAAKHMVQLDTLAGVQKNKTAVKRQAVTTTVMPEQNPKPTSAERQKLGQWLDCGAN